VPAPDKVLTWLCVFGPGVPTGTPLSDPPLVSAISEDPLLRNVKLIAEAWDCDGLYQVGSTTSYRPPAQPIYQHQQRIQLYMALLRARHRH